MCVCVCVITDLWGSIAYLIFLIFFIISIRRSAPIEDEDVEPTPDEEEEELREEPKEGRFCKSS